jgi:polysaccharide export outer membrane protein
VTPGLPYNDQKIINEVGNITLQNLGQVHVSGLTPTQLEAKIGQLAVDKGFLLAKGNGSPGPQVSVQLMQSRARIFSLLGQVQAAGTYNIIGTDFRLLDALALGRDVAGLNQPGMDYLYVIRPQKNAGVIPAAAQPTAAPATNPLKALDTLKPGAAAPTTPATPAGDGPVLLRPLPQVVTLTDIPEPPKVLAQAGLDAAISGGTSVLPPAAPAPATMPAAAPSPVAPAATEPVDLSQAVGGTASKPGMIFVNGKWVEASPGAAETMTPGEAEAAASGVSIPRVIRIPINRLKEGDPRYNIVIRPGDIINVPNIEPGEFYLLGHINRPGVYSLTGRKVTLKQAVAAAGGLDPVAIPRRCDLIRRIGNTEVTVQVDLQRIFDGEQPDIFLKSNDLVNVGTDMIAPFLAVTRNAYRASYGWGFTYDRNFYNQPVISQPAK